MTDSTQKRYHRSKRPPSDDQNCHTETPQGVKREIVGKVFSFSVRFRREYFGRTGIYKSWIPKKSFGFDIAPSSLCLILIPLVALHLLDLSHLCRFNS